jgi:acyl transferase domain-containing protein/NADPH:quinone reductase-like Zn-dependent oxidoreductase
MPGPLRQQSRSSSIASDSSSNTDRNSIISEDYAAASFPGYSEKPLDEQLEPIAVVGMGCRLPGDVKSPAAFWDLMMSKSTGNTPKVPANRFNIDAYLHKNNDRPGSFGVPGGYFLTEDLSNFDPTLFNITPIEAMWMDPQQRKLLEVIYEALEAGGISLEKISGTRTAVFAATFTADWQQMSFKEASFRHSLAATGVDPGIISNRISHVFNLNGPSIVCNTACSSSVYALHNACNALRNYEAEGAIVGGVNLIITVDQHMNTAKLGVLSPTSTCHTFDASADGYGRADAVGAVYLKRLADAVRDGDPIRGVIRSSATNSNGKVAAVGITYPNRDGQAAVIAHAYQRGGNLDPKLTGYFECHGTGTAIGDPIEVEAVAIAMNKNRGKDEEPLNIGAVKTNIGHSEAASGLSALIKAVLAVERGIIPPTRGLVNKSSKIKWEDWKVDVVTEPKPFPAHLPVHRVSINSFGYGGTNAHVIVESADTLLKRPQTYKYLDSFANKTKKSGPKRSSFRKRPYILPFSAHDKPTLMRNIEAHGRVANNYSLLDISHTLANRRSNLQSKGFAVVSPDTLEDTFEAAATTFNFAEKKKTPTIGYVFTGQGAQWARMGADLLKNSPRFFKSVRALDSALEDLPDGPSWSIEDLLLAPAEFSRVNEPEFSQPLCTAVQVCLVQLLESWGVKPVVTVGHSSGEIAAAYAAGFISSREAITLAYYRGLVTRDVKTKGAMMAVGLGADEVAPYLEGVEGIVIACHNSPNGVTLSGDVEKIEQVQEKLSAENIFARIVKTNGKAYHSHHMAPVGAQYEKYIRNARQVVDFGAPKAGNAQMVSSVTNEILEPGTKLDETYWNSNLKSPVLFNQAVQTILTDDEFADVNLLIEIGPHSAMKGPIQQIKTLVKAPKVEYVSTLLRGENSAVNLLNVAGELWLRNYPIDMERVTTAYVEDTSQDKYNHSGKGCTIVDLPTYQWNYARPFWAENRASREQRLPVFPRHDVLGQMVIGSSLAEPTWRNVLRTRDLPWLKDHSLGGETVFPATGYFAMAIEALTQLNELSENPVEIHSYVLRDVSIQKALITPDHDDGIEAILNLRPSIYAGESNSKVTWWDFGVSSIDLEGTMKEHMLGSIAINARPRGPKARDVPPSAQRASGKAWNDALRDVGFNYGPTFQDMDNIRFDGKNYWAASTTSVKQEVDESLGESRYPLHPAAVDSVLQLCIAAIHAGRTNAMEYGAIPIQVSEVAIFPPSEAQLQDGKANALAWCDQRGLRNFDTSAQMVAADGEVLAEISNLRCVSYEAAVPQKDSSALRPAPYGEFTWEVDVDSTDKVEDLSAADLTNSVLYKYPSKKVLHLGTRGVKEILEKNTRATYNVLPLTEEDKEAAKAATEGSQGAKIVELEATAALPEGSFEVLVVDKGVSAETVSQIWHTIKADGYILAEGIDGEALTDYKVIAQGSNGVSLGRKSSKGSKSSSQADRPVQLVYREKQASIVDSVGKALTTLGWAVETVALKDIVSKGIKEHVILLADFEGPLLSSVKQNEFEAIREITQEAGSILWVTPGGLEKGKHPEFAMVRGLARTVTSEQAATDFRTIDIDLDTITEEQAVSHIAEIASFQAAEDEEVPEREFSLSDGKRLISRLDRNKTLNALFAAGDAEERTFSPESRIHGKVVSGKVVFEEVLGEKEVKPGHVEVQVQYSGLTKEGVLVITGSDYPTTFSHEIGGVVLRVGSGVDSVKPGDKVVGIHANTYGSIQEVAAPLLYKLRDEDDLAASTSVLISYAAAIYGLETLARLEAGERVLVLPETGASGVAALKYTIHAGGEPLALARKQEEVDYLKKEVGLTDEQIILLSADIEATTQIKSRTGSHGVDIVFTTGNTDVLLNREAWRSIARFGRFLDSGRKDVLRRSALDGVPAARGACYLPFDILDLYEGRPKVLAKLLPTVLKLAQEGAITPPGKLEKVNLADFNEAVAKYSDDLGSAKTVIEYAASDKTINVLPARPKMEFSPNSTYLLVGCLGGLGRSLTSWMMESGARRFVFLSRSGTDAPSAARLVSDIEAKGAICTVVRGDATSRPDVVRAVEGVPAEYPVKGVVHAAMVLRDGLFSSMTYENWVTAINPKTLGAANLHSVLSDSELDFFLMTSSVSGVLGNPTQANYAAANTYLDALAHHRRVANKTAVSLVLPMVLEVGVVAENSELEQSLKRKGMYGIDEEHLLQGFEAGVVASSGAAATHQIVIGLDPAKLHKAVKDEAVTDSYWLEDSRFSHAVQDINSASEETGGSGGAQSILVTIKAAGSPAEANELVAAHFQEKLARMLLLGEEAFDRDAKSIASYGIDSMIGAELRKWIFKEYRMDVPFQQLLGPTLSINKFAKQICENHGIGAPAA